MNREEMMKMMQEAKLDGSSKLHLRSESIQTKVRVNRIPRLKKSLKKKSKLLIITDLALPFNPETGVADDQFNADNKYRPPFSATSVALSLKEWADTNEALKKTLMARAGVESWDTSDHDTLNDDDVKIFIRYRVPRVFTVPVVHVNIPVMTKSEYGRDYLINVERDPMTGQVVGEVPGVLKVNKFLRDIAYEKLEAYQKQLDSGELKHTDEQQKEEKRRIFNEIPVSDDHPSNFITAFEIPLTFKYEISSDANLAGVSAEEMKNFLVMSSYSKGIRTAIESYVSGEWSKFDKYLDFYEIDMNCPNEGDEDSKQGKMRIGLDTKYEKPQESLEDAVDYAKIEKTIRDCIDGMVDIEEQMRCSMSVTPYTDSVENQLFTALKTVVDIVDNEFVTKKVLTENNEVVSLAYGDTAAELLEEIDAGISEKVEGVLDVEKAQKTAKTYNLDSSDFSDDVDLSEIAAME